MLKTRVISALVFVPVILLATYFGGYIFAALMLAIAVIGGYEFGKMLEVNGYRLFPWIYYPVAVLLILMAQLAPTNGGVLVAVAFLGFAAIMTQFVLGKMYIDEVGVNILAMVYIPLTLTTAVLMRSGMDDGMYLIFLLLIIEWLTDSGAYFIGTAFGKHKLMPRVSPKKSIEGALGGIAAAVVAALLLNLFTHIAPYWLIVIIAVVVSVAGQLGDLGESAVKRWAKVKDSGNLIPGHGGILDRFDSMFFAAPVTYLIFSIYQLFV